MFKVLVSKTFTLYTPASIEGGASANNGFEYRNNEFTADNREELVEELVRVVQDEKLVNTRWAV